MAQPGHGCGQVCASNGLDAERGLTPAVRLWEGNCGFQQAGSFTRFSRRIHLIAYNVLRRVMAVAAQHQHLTPGQISFQGALQTVKAFREEGLLMDIRRVECFATLLAAIASHRVGDRPNRVEPRAIKRRPKPHDILTVPRAVARKRLPESNVSDSCGVPFEYTCKSLAAE